MDENDEIIWDEDSEGYTATLGQNIKLFTWQPGNNHGWVARVNQVMVNDDDSFRERLFLSLEEAQDAAEELAREMHRTEQTD